jgi:hypothetical protein
MAATLGTAYVKNVAHAARTRYHATRGSVIADASRGCDELMPLYNYEQ